MKKIMSLVLALVLCLCAAMPAFAADAAFTFDANTYCLIFDQLMVSTLDISPKWTDADVNTRVTTIEDMITISVVSDANGLVTCIDTKIDVSLDYEASYMAGSVFSLVPMTALLLTNPDLVSDQAKVIEFSTALQAMMTNAGAVLDNSDSTSVSDSLTFGGMLITGTFNTNETRDVLNMQFIITPEVK